MLTQGSGIEIYTIGHSNSTANKIIELLCEYQIDVLVDVRSSPYSQYAAHFNRETIAGTLSEFGIEYVFAGQFLGGHPKDPTCYKDGKLPLEKADYLKIDYSEVAKRPWYQKGITRLIEIADEHRIAIMCSEENPNQCHRHHLIAQTLLEMGITVWHIRGQGFLEIAKVKIEEELEESKQPQQINLFGSLAFNWGMKII